MNHFEAIRNAALEAAAKIADEWVESKSCKEGGVCEHQRTASMIAERIRGLKTEKRARKAKQ